jgi:hypothetical protein
MSYKMNLGSNRCCINDIVKGITGTQGRIGVGGPIGPIGNTGSTGTTGPQGDTGLCYRGYKGPQGDVGPQGGTQGPVGLMGSRGPSGTGVAQNLNFSFTTSNSASYSSSGFSDLTGLVSTPLTSNDIILSTTGNYLIKYNVALGWMDTGNKFYVRFNNGSTYENSTVFNGTTPLVLTTNTNINKMYGTGNDLVSLSSTNYTIELLQSTTSGTVVISNKPVNFSITFIKLS